MGAGGGEISKGMQTIDVAAVDERAEFFSVSLGRIPVGKLAGRHVEVEGVPHFQADTGTHGGFLRGVEEAHQLEVSRRVGRFIEVAADGEEGRQGRRGAEEKSRRVGSRESGVGSRESGAGREEEESKV